MITRALAVRINKLWIPVSKIQAETVLWDSIGQFWDPIELYWDTKGQMVLIDHLDHFGMFGRGSSDPTGTFSLWNVNITARLPAVLKRDVVLWALACFDTMCHRLLGPQTKAPENALLHLTNRLIQLEYQVEYQIITLLLL